MTPTTLGAVLASKAYMLFYVKRSLAYAQRITLTPKVDATPQLATKRESTSEASVVHSGPTGGADSALSPNSAVGGKGVATKGLGLGGKGGHPIRGMEV